MVRLSVFAFVISALIASVAGSNAFANDNPIRQVVSDGLHELESSILQVIGSTRHAYCFARFAHKFVFNSSSYIYIYNFFFDIFLKKFIPYNTVQVREEIREC